MKYLLVCFILLTTGCTVLSKKSGLPFVPEERFYTRVLDNGTKRFFFSFSVPTRILKEKQQRREVVYRGNQRTEIRAIQSPLISKEVFYQALQQRAKHKISLIKYCKNGYQEHVDVISHNYVSLFGECNESATNAEIDYFRKRQHRVF